MSHKISLVLLVLLFAVGCNSAQVSIANTQIPQAVSTSVGAPTETLTPSITPYPARQAQGYAIDILYDEAAQEVYKQEVYPFEEKAAYPVQEGWRFWLATVSLENPDGNLNRDCIKFEGRNGILATNLVDSGGFEHKAFVSFRPMTEGFTVRLCPNVGVVAYAYGEIPKNQSPTSISLSDYTDQPFNIDLTKTSQASYPILDTSVTLPSQQVDFGNSNNSFAFKVSPLAISPTKNSDQDKLSFRIDLENNGGQNFRYDRIRITAIDNYGRWYVENSQDADIGYNLVPGEKRSFDLGATYPGPSRDGITRVLALIWIDVDDDYSYYFEGQLYYDFESGQPALEVPLAEQTAEGGDGDRSQ